MSMSSASIYDVDDAASARQMPKIAEKLKTMQDYTRDRLFQDFLMVGLPLSKDKLRAMELG